MRRFRLWLSSPPVSMGLLVIGLVLLLWLFNNVNFGEDDFLRRFRDADGNFSYPELPFGSDLRYTGIIIGYMTLDEDNLTPGVYGEAEIQGDFYDHKQSVFSIYNHNSYVTVWFRQQQLFAVQWEFESGDKGDMKRALKVLRESYGEPESTTGTEGALEVERYRWTSQGERPTTLTCSLYTDPEKEEVIWFRRRPDTYRFVIDVFCDP